MPKTTFTYDVDDFAFINSFSFDEQETNTILGITRGAVDAALVLIGGPFGAAAAVLGAGARISEWIAGAVVPPSYGLCAGMAFASLDYFKAGLIVPRGPDAATQPDRSTPEGTVLRDYLWRRLIDDHMANGSKFLGWMAVLHVVPKEFPFFGGHPWLRDRTKEEFARLKQHIDANEPWPIGLIGSNTNPFSNHVVLATGYEDPGDGTATVYIYDMNCPGRENAITLDFRGEMLEAGETCGSRDGYTPLRAFFCQNYSFVSPPVAVGLEAGLAVNPTDGVRQGDNVQFNFTVRNYGFGPTPLFKPFAAGRVVPSGQVIDPGAIGDFERLQVGSDRAAQISAPMVGPAGRRRFFASALVAKQGPIFDPNIDPFEDIPLDSSNGQPSWTGWRNLPAVGPGTTNDVTINVQPPKDMKDAKDKENKDRKDNKEDDKRPNKEVAKEKDRDANDLGSPSDDTSRGLVEDTDDQSSPKGRPFITADERPTVGAGLTDEQDIQHMGDSPPPGPIPVYPA